MKHILSILVVTALGFGCAAEKTDAENHGVPNPPTPTSENKPATPAATTAVALEQPSENPKSPPATTAIEVKRSEPAAVVKPTKPVPAVASKVQPKETKSDESIPPTLTLVHAANLQGEIEPCG